MELIINHLKITFLEFPAIKTIIFYELVIELHATYIRYMY